MEALEADTYRPSCPPEFIFDKLYLTTFISHSIMLGKKKEPSFTFYFRFLNDLIQVALLIISVKIFFFFLMHWEKKHITLFSFLKIFGPIYVTWRFTPRTTSLQCLDTETIRYKRWGMVWLILVMKFLIAHSSVMIKFRI